MLIKIAKMYKYIKYPLTDLLCSSGQVKLRYYQWLLSANLAH